MTLATFTYLVHCPSCEEPKMVPRALSTQPAVFRCGKCRNYFFLLRRRIGPSATRFPKKAGLVRTTAVTKFRGYYGVVERTLDGYDVMLLDLNRQPLTPRVHMRRLDQIYDYKQPFRKILKDPEKLTRLIIGLQQASRDLTVPEDKKPKKTKKTEASQHELEDVLVEEAGFYTAHPAGDRTADGRYVLEYTTAPRKDDPITKLNTLAWLNRETGERGIVPFDDRARSIKIEDKTFYLLKEIDTETGVQNLLSTSGLKKWMDKNYAPDPHETWNQVLTFCKKYVYFMDPESYYVLAAWIIATYFFYNMSTFPYLNPIGPAEMGKTTVLRIARQLAYHANAITIPREASVFRSVDAYLCTLLNDEGDNIINYDSGIQDIFNSGFQKGARVPREFPLGDGTFKTRYFDAYSPKMITSKRPLPDMVDSRAIKLFMRGQPPKGIDYGQYEDELVDLKTGEALRDDLYVLRLLLQNKFIEEYQKINFYQEQKIRGREALLFKPLVAVVRVFCPTRLEEEQIIKAAMQHGELRRVSRHALREAKATKAILAVLKEDHPKDFDKLQEACRDYLAGKPKEESLLQEIALTNKEIHDKYTELFQSHIAPRDKGYLSVEGMSRLLQQTMGHHGVRKRVRTIIIPFGRLIHDVLTYELYDEIGVEEPETGEADLLPLMAPTTGDKTKTDVSEEKPLAAICSDCRFWNTKECVEEKPSLTTPTATYARNCSGFQPKKRLQT